MAAKAKRTPAKRSTTKRRAAKRGQPKRAKAKRAGAKRKYWSGEVTAHSDALDLTGRVFTWRDPKRIARSLKQSAERSKRRKTGPYQSAMSMLNFYLNRGGRNLPADRKRVLDQAKTELRRLFGREA
jgi:Protein of unknown function (DUF3175)